MRKHGGKELTLLLLMGISILLFLTVAHGFSDAGVAASAKEHRKAITASTATPKSGFFAWLESWLPNGIRLNGPRAELRNSAEVLATANCFNSGAGITCNGFRSLEEYVAAVRVSESLGIRIPELQARMQQGRMLSEAVQELRPGVKGQMEALRAEQEARAILRDFSS